MIELLTTLVIVASSILLFAYWFRYTCLLMLSARTAHDYAAQVAAANQLSFLSARSELTSGAPDLERLRDQLDRDYAVLSRLLKGSSGDSFVEHRMLGLDYKMMGAWSRLSGPFSTAAARRALEEMTAVVAHMANTVGEHAACAAAA